MRLVKSVLYYKANTVEKGNIFSTIMEVTKEENGVLSLKDNNGYEEAIPIDFKGRFFIEESSTHLIKVSLYRKIKEGSDIATVFQKNEKNVKRKTLEHIKDVVMMYRELYKNVIKIINKYDVKKAYSKEEIAKWGEIKEVE